ncbi:hypothetical protein C4580_06475 [Candidatus Woesearchaeota archaeon]|nr:MAG: hypothetical protein C4580_06475 [Candidatus Woesearchaeota archaeon]
MNELTELVNTKTIGKLEHFLENDNCNRIQTSTDLYLLTDSEEVTYLPSGTILGKEQQEMLRRAYREDRLHFPCAYEIT